MSAAPMFDEDLGLADWMLFARLREGLGGKIAIRWGERGYTYDEVADRSLRVAAALAGLGVRPGERVYLVLPDGPAFAWAFFGTLAAGAVVTMGNPELPATDLAQVIDYVGARAVITVPR